MLRLTRIVRRAILSVLEEIVKSADAVAIPRIGALLSHVKSELKKFLGVKLKRLIIYGSYSRGDYDNESDLDLMALVDAPHPDETFEEQVLDVMVNLSLEHDAVISIFLENEQEYENLKNFKPFFKKVEREGIEIHQLEQKDYCT